MKIIKCFFILSFMLLIGCSSSKEISSTMQQSKEFKESITIKLNYLLYLPKEYNKSDSLYPLVLFLHGIGERGENLELVMRHGPPMLVEKGKDFPFILVSPQCSESTTWAKQTTTLNKLLDDIIENYKVDTNRIYLTGLSMGGNGTWSLAVAYPDRFAAIAPVCGWGSPFDMRDIKNIPAWAFHGAKDSAVPIENSQELIDALKRLGAKPKFTIYPDADHDSWTETYNNPELYDWLLSHKKKSK
jgi:predicted peptidase